MDISELREIIWEDLFRAKAKKSIDELSAELNCDAADVRAAVTHEWFDISADQASIAYAGRRSELRRWLSS